jgi:hypothetical protein
MEIHRAALGVLVRHLCERQVEPSVPEAEQLSQVF